MTEEVVKKGDFSGMRYSEKEERESGDRKEERRNGKLEKEMERK